LLSMPASPERIRTGVCDPRSPQAAQHVVAGHIWQVQVEEDDVVRARLSAAEPLFAKGRRDDLERLGPEHQLNALRQRRLVLDQQNPHRPAPAPNVQRGLGVVNGLLGWSVNNPFTTSFAFFLTLLERAVLPEVRLRVTLVSQLTPASRGGVIRLCGFRAPAFRRCRALPGCPGRGRAEVGGG
jgi:hypothetical protein